MDVWLDGGGARGSPHQLLNLDLILKENFKNKTITEFPVLTVLSKGTGPPQTQLNLASQTTLKAQGGLKVTGGAQAVVKVEGGLKVDAAKTAMTGSQSAVKAEGCAGGDGSREGERGCEEGRGDNGEVGRGCEEGRGDSGEGGRGCEEGRGGGSDWSDGEGGIEEGEIVDAAVCHSASLRMIASLYSDSEDSSN